MKDNIITEEINGTTVYYTMFKGIIDNRYEMAFLINREWKIHTLIATKQDKRYRMEEVVEMYKNLSRMEW